MRKVLNSPNGRGLVGPFSNRGVITTGNFRSAHGGGFGEAGMWYGGFDCGTGIADTIAIRANSELTYTDATGITVTRNGTVQATSVSINASTPSPQTEFLLDVTWDAPITAFDVIELQYDSTTGNFSNEDGELPSATHSVINCESVGPRQFVIVAESENFTNTNTIICSGGPFGVDWGDGVWTAHLDGANASAVASGTITIVSQFPITKCTFVSNTFKSVDLRSTQTLTDCSSMFSSIMNLTEFICDNESLANVTDFSAMFSNCSGLKSINNLNTSSGVTFDTMFGGCSGLTCLGQLDTTNQTSTTNMFFGCDALVAPDATEQTALLSGATYTNTGECPAPKGWDVATFNYQNTKTFGDQSNNRGVNVSSDGTSLFVSGQTAKLLNQYTLSTPFDISTESGPVDSFNMSSQPLPFGGDFAGDGAHYYINNFNGLVVQADLSTPWVASSAVTTANSFDPIALVGSPAQFYARGLCVTEDGLHLYIADEYSDSIYQFDFGVAYDASTVTYNGKFFNVDADETSVQDVDMKPDGTRMFVIGKGTDKAIQYDLDIPYDVSSAVRTAGASVPTINNPESIKFDNSGENVYNVTSTGQTYWTISE